MGIVGLIAGFALGILFMAGNIKLSEGKARTAAIIVNAAMLGAFLIMIVLLSLHYGSVANDSEKYYINGRGIFGSVSYTGENEDYYFFKESKFIHGAEDIAVPKSNATLPLTAKVCKTVYLYCHENASFSYIEIDSKEYCLYSEVFRIRINYTDLVIAAGFLDIVTNFLYNMISLFICICIVNKTDMPLSQQNGISQ
ncbi:MAG: hypothetical protein ACI4KF_01905 [Huintestinicola sp.]